MGDLQKQFSDRLDAAETVSANAEGGDAVANAILGGTLQQQETAATTAATTVTAASLGNEGVLEENFFQEEDLDEEDNAVVGELELDDAGGAGELDDFTGSGETFSEQFGAGAGLNTLGDGSSDTRGGVFDGAASTTGAATTSDRLLDGFKSGQQDLGGAGDGGDSILGAQQGQHGRLAHHAHRHDLPERTHYAQNLVGGIIWVLVILHVLALLVWLRAWWRQKRSKDPTMRALTPGPPQKVTCSYDMDKAFSIPKIELPIKSLGLTKQAKA